MVHDTRSFARILGLVVFTTPFYSPEPKGMAEAFIKTFKRHYVRINQLNDARTVMVQLPKWFEGYNTSYPDKGLKMRLPREYRELIMKFMSRLKECPVSWGQLDEQLDSFCLII
jgi:transposase InsO family protein